jgi:hypothetical protein
LTILPSLTTAVKLITSTPISPRIVFAASITAAFAASSQLLGELPMISTTLTCFEFII